ncbi:unnamed protein product [Brassica rapa subsp. narinosa]
MACLLKYIFGRILGVAPTKAFPRTCFNSRPPHVHSQVKQPAWKCATTEWWAVRFLHRLQQEVGQIMECTIPQQMCITQDHRGFKVNGSGGYELLSCLADLDGQQYLFQIRITPYNFTPRHRTFTVSAISDDICS